MNAESFNIGIMRLFKSKAERVVSSSKEVALLTLNVPEIVRLSPERCPPQPIFWPKSCAKVRMYVPFVQATLNHATGVSYSEIRNL